MNKFLTASLAVVLGLCVWLTTATLGNLVFRALIPGYAAVEQATAFTLATLVARILLGLAVRTLE